MNFLTAYRYYRIIIMLIQGFSLNRNICSIYKIEPAGYVLQYFQNNKIYHFYISVSGKYYGKL